MIRVELQGGLGNQLFIWAMAHRLSEDYKSDIRIIVPRNRKSRTDRPCELFDLANLCDHRISISESWWFSQITKAIDKLNNFKFVIRLDLMHRLGIITQKDTYDISIANSRAPRILRGYFQSTEIAESTKNVIFNEILSYLKSLEFPEVVTQSEVIKIVHIRRGDTKQISQEWGILSLEYYEKLINQSDELVICTDESDFKEKIVKKFPHSLIVSPEESSAWQVLKIMTNSKDFVMANSTLSWWGGWLAINKGGTKVYLPDPWRPNNPKAGQSLNIKLAISVPAIFESKS